MKAIRKYTTIFIAVVIGILIVVKLYSNKRELDSNLKNMLEYSSIIPVEVITPKILQANQILEENGVLRCGTEVDILSETSGRVIAVNGNIGEAVNTGQPLVVVDKEVLESQNKLAKSGLENAEKDLKRYHNLAGGDAITQQQLEASKLNYQNALANYTLLRKQLENTTIQAPLDGVISKRSVEKGTYLTPSIQVFSILVQNQMNFVVKVSEFNVYQITKGQKVEISLDILPGKTFFGTARSIGVSADMSGRYEVEISLGNHGALLRPGMGGKASFVMLLKGSGIVIPRKCIVGSIKDAKVFILAEDHVVSRMIKVIAMDENQVMVTEGLSMNEKVVLSGQINLLDGTQVKVIHL